MSDRVTRDGADTSSYVMRDERKRSIDPLTSPRALMGEAKISDGVAPDESERPATKPQITPAIIEENLRRVRAGAANTLIRVLPDGKREYHEDRVVRDTDGLQDTVTYGQRIDRGEGTRDSLDILSKEGRVRADGLLPKRSRDSAGRFTKRQP